MKKEKIIEYDILRVIVTMLVLISHCMYYKIQTNYGGIDYSICFMKTPLIFKLLEHLKEVIYSFHMPLFMALSGALFCKTEIGNHKNYQLFVISKFKRLVLPFIIINICYSIPLKYIAKYWINSNDILKDIVVGQLLLQGNNYLWFLATLFLIFNVAYFVKKINIPMLYVYILSVLLYFISSNIQIVIIKDVLQYILWFYLGYYFETKREKINYQIHKKDILLYSVIYIFFFCINRCHFNNIIMYEIINIILGIVGCYITYIISYLISKTAIQENIIYKEILDTSLGLYLYSDPWNYIIIGFVYNLCGSMIFNTNIGALFLFGIRFILTFLIAYLISIIIRKFKLRYFY